ncbi:CidA/LrgA family protein [Planococcus sp. YIM B11945]|uniref:CidA/LrgA family protein n=1 Tax=Planococcus sp. YIM B11945 TaxID=3435410 RepID=UPI003D7EF1FD
MKFFLIFIQILVLYGFYWLGDWLRGFFGLPLPGSIIGFLILFAALMLKIYPLRWIESGAHFLLAFLSLYFIPATVGVIGYGDVLSGRGVWLIVIVIISTLATMAVSGLLSQWSSRNAERKEER